MSSFCTIRSSAVPDVSAKNVRIWAAIVYVYVWSVLVFFFKNIPNICYNIFVLFIIRVIGFIKIFSGARDSQSNYKNTGMYSSTKEYKQIYMYSGFKDKQ
jgi:hypothetical protein